MCKFGLGTKLENAYRVYEAWENILKVGIS